MRMHLPLKKMAKKRDNNSQPALSSAEPLLSDMAPREGPLNRPAGHLC